MGDKTMKSMKTIFRKPSRYEVRQTVLRWLLIIFGNAVTAAASSFFIVPGGLVVGGTTGVGIFVEQIWDFEYARVVTVYAANIALFLLGTILLGKSFFWATLAGTFLYPAFLSLFDAVNAAYVAAHGTTLSGGDLFLDVFYGSLLFGAGIGLVVRVGASTGGTDIPPLLLQHFFGIPVSISLWVLDFAVVLLQLFADATMQTILYGIVICVLSSVVIEVVTPLGQRKMQVKIVSHRYPEIREMILNDLDRGVTMLYGKTGYLREKCYMLLTVVSPRELVRLKNKVQQIDPDAFLTVSVVSEVRGRGFSRESVYLPKEEEGKGDLSEVTEGAEGVPERIAPPKSDPDR